MQGREGRVECAGFNVVGTVCRMTQYSVQSPQQTCSVHYVVFSVVYSTVQFEFSFQDTVCRVQCRVEYEGAVLRLQCEWCARYSVQGPVCRVQCAVIYTRRYDPLRGPTSSSCGKLIMMFWPIFGVQ